MKIQVIVLNWNGRDDTLACLESLRNQTSTDFFVRIVDNASSDDSVNAIREKFPEFEILELDKNYKYAGGNNRGTSNIQHPISVDEIENHKYLMFLNNDTILAEDCIEKLLEEVEKYPNLGVAGTKIYYKFPSQKIWSAGGIVQLWKGKIAHIGIRENDSGQFDEPKIVNYVTGAAMLIPSKIWFEIGGFDESFSMYGEDVDLCLRVTKLGKEIRYFPSAKVWHSISASTGGEFSIYKMKQKVKALFKIIVLHGKWWHFFTAPVFFGISSVFQIVKLSGKDTDDK
ncbi:glycosyltransferase family 2 protein [bacterium]|nr:glycosyltransferase family 2 protein [bacterium]